MRGIFKLVDVTRSLRACALKSRTSQDSIATLDVDSGVEHSKVALNQPVAGLKWGFVRRKLKRSEVGEIQMYARLTWKSPTRQGKATRQG